MIAGIGLQWIDFKLSIEFYLNIAFAVMLLLVGIFELIKSAFLKLKKWLKK